MSYDGIIELLHCKRGLTLGQVTNKSILLCNGQLVILCFHCYDVVATELAIKSEFMGEVI